VALKLNRSLQIRSGEHRWGGYLRSLTDKARAGQFSIGPVLMSLLRTKSRWGVGKLLCHWPVSIWLAPRYLLKARKARIFRNKGVLPMTTTVTAAAVSKNFGAYQDAAVRDPVIITKNGRPRTVLLAYEDFVRLSKRDRRVDLTAELSADEIAAVEASEMEPGLDHLNDELPGTKSLTAKNAAS
jgi:prevent-host-death family protein